MSHFDPLQEVRRHEPAFRSASARRSDYRDSRTARNRIASAFILALLLALPAFAGARYVLQHPEEIRGWMQQASIAVKAGFRSS